MGALLIILLQISNWVRRWKNCENRSIFSKDMDKSIASPFFDSRCSIIIYPLMSTSVTCVSLSLMACFILCITDIVTKTHKRACAILRSFTQHNIYQFVCAL